jgi:16S rRNA (cytosine1402-N4)-methyltransferase
MDVSRDPVHVPVMLDRVLALLAPALGGLGTGDQQGSDAGTDGGGAVPGRVVVDATLGLGGHTEALLARFPGVTVVGLDRDPDALARSARRLAPYAGRTHLVHAVYDQMPQVLADLGMASVDGILFDLGVSSMQLDEPGRGFSYAQDAPLDMRMDPERGMTAERVIADYPVPELARILREYGEERFALRIAQAIDRRRRQGPLTSSAELADLVRTAIPAATRRTGGHPAKRTFQALRIEVNDELGVLRAAVPAALDRLRVGGRMVVLTYHSLEDRIVKQAFAADATDRTPVGLPVALADHGPALRLIGRSGETPSAQEIEANPRAASARLRAVERLRAAS